MGPTNEFENPNAGIPNFGSLVLQTGFEAKATEHNSSTECYDEQYKHICNVFIAIHTMYRLGDDSPFRSKNLKKFNKVWMVLNGSFLGLFGGRELTLCFIQSCRIRKTSIK